MVKREDIMAESCGQKIRVIVSGGGTAGHIYPAVALVETLEWAMGKESVEVLFVGAEGKMESQKVPELGYKIELLPIVGLQRKFTFKNLLFPFKLLRSLSRATRIVSKFNPDVVVGFGGYASTPILKAAQMCDMPTILWEGNSYAGMANKALAKRARHICVAYEGMERFFPKNKLVLTGNPIRGNFSKVVRKSAEAMEYFGFSGERPVVLVTGGSLGARVLNDSVSSHLKRIAREKKFDLIWQCGSYYYQQMSERLEAIESDNIWLGAFISRMDYAYGAADLVVSRAGGSAIAELSLLGMAAIFVPSSTVAENHQYKNAKALADRGAALLVTDDDAPRELIPMVESVVDSPSKLAELRAAVGEFAYPDAAVDIANLVLQVAGKSKRIML